MWIFATIALLVGLSSTRAQPHSGSGAGGGDAGLPFANAHATTIPPCSNLDLTQDCGGGCHCSADSTCAQCDSLTITGAALPSVIRALPAASLTKLILTGNKLGGAVLSTSSFEGLSKLEVLDLSGTELSTLPPTIFRPLTAMTTLSLQNNSITTLDTDIFASNTAIIGLNLISNRLNSLEGFLHPLTKLKVLQASMNNVQSISASAFAKSADLEIVSLSKNRIRTLEGLFTGLNKLQKVSLSTNAITSLAPVHLKGLDQLVNLGLFDNMITSVGADTFLSNPRLNRLSLANNRLTFFADTAIVHLTELALLNLANNQLSTLPLLNTTFLSFLSLSGNLVTDVLGFQDNLNNFWGERRTQFPFIQLVNNPVSCALELPLDQFRCHCSSLFIENDEGLCVPPTPTDSTFPIVAGVFGGVVSGLTLVWFGLLLRRRFNLLRENLGENERLLSRRNVELLELKSAWDIPCEDVELLKRIDTASQGAFGEVWFGQWDGLQVAVKRLKLGLFKMDDLAAADFEIESDFLRKCRHRNIVRFFGAGRWADSGQWDGVPFLVTEYMSSGALSTFLKENPNVSQRQKLAFALDIQSGMQYIHALGRIHRDLKTANVLLSDQLRAKVADFGSLKNLFHHASARQTEAPEAFRERLLTDISAISALHPQSENSSISTTMMVGTPMYMSPEALRGDKCGPATDVWSYAVVLWEIYAQKVPDIANGRRWRNYVMQLEKALVLGERLPTDGEHPAPIVELIHKCWELHAPARPNFGEIGGVLELMAEASLNPHAHTDQVV